MLFSYTEKHTQDAVAKLFAGFRGLLQSDASSVYHLLERGPPSDEEGAVELVGCRVGGGVAAPAPHRSGRAGFPHPVLHGGGLLAAA